MDVTSKELEIGRGFMPANGANGKNAVGVMRGRNTT
jgi:hypothetical protein